jgi:hypothetical protein
MDLNRDWSKNDYNWFWESQRTWPGLPEELKGKVEAEMLIQKKIAASNRRKEMRGNEWPDDPANEG